MGKKEKLYLVLDTETATLPFADSIARTAKEKQNIAIAKPLVYDIGWTICNRKGEIRETKEFLVQETFFVPQVFNTAYYRDKRPQYMERFETGEIRSKPWNEIIKLLLKDLRKTEFCAAYNAAFDFKKAIPFTERYIKAIYSTWYQKWEDRQYKTCKDIAVGNNNSKNEEYLNPIFDLRNEEFPIVDLWGYACERLINNNRYKKFCLDNGIISPGGFYFKSSAESVYKYFLKDNNFIEAHTALEDAKIETIILSKILAKGSVKPKIQAFPFRTLGQTVDYVLEKKIKNEEHLKLLIDILTENLKGRETSVYTSRLENAISILRSEL